MDWIVKESLWLHFNLFLVFVNDVNVLMFKHFIILEGFLSSHAAEAILALKRVKLLAWHCLEIDLRAGSALFYLIQNRIDVLGCLLRIHREFVLTKVPVRRIIDTTFLLTSICSSVDIGRCSEIGGESLVETVTTFLQWGMVSGMMVLMEVATAAKSVFGVDCRLLTLALFL